MLAAMADLVVCCMVMGLGLPDDIFEYLLGNFVVRVFLMTTFTL